VVSSLVRVSFPEIPPVEVQDPGLLIRLVKSSFSGRRKTLRNTLRSPAIAGLTPEILAAAADEAGIDLGRRAETLSPQEFARFADAIRSRVNPSKRL
jgi:16S rRNA (adenine1518-N6/adenine1519-N6)-dimethyltransferase